MNSKDFIVKKSTSKNGCDIHCYSLKENRNQIGGKFLGEDCYSEYRGECCFFLEKLYDMSFMDCLSEILNNLNLDSSRFDIKEESDYYSLYLDNNLLGIWSDELSTSFYEEGENMRIKYYHDEDGGCEECESGDCLYSKDEESFKTELLSDKLNLPIFNVAKLLNALEINVEEF